MVTRKLKTALERRLGNKSPSSKSSGSGICCVFVKLGKLSPNLPKIGIKCFGDAQDAEWTFRYHEYLSKHPDFKKYVPRVFGKLFTLGDMTCYAVEEVFVVRTTRKLRSKIEAKYGTGPMGILNAKDKLADRIKKALVKKFRGNALVINSFMSDSHNGNYGYRDRSPYLVWIDFSI